MAGLTVGPSNAQSGPHTLMMLEVWAGLLKQMQNQGTNAHPSCVTPMSHWDPFSRNRKQCLPCLDLQAVQRITWESLDNARGGDAPLVPLLLENREEKKLS